MRDTFFGMQTRTPAFIPTIHEVNEDCNMINFAKKHVENYDPDSGKGYYQLIDGVSEYISDQTDIVLITKVCAVHHDQMLT